VSCVLFRLPASRALRYLIDTLSLTWAIAEDLSTALYRM